MITRRDLLCAGAALLILPSGCDATYAKPVDMLAEPFQTIAFVHRDIFPGSSSIPSPRFLKALDYLGGVMEDPYIEESEKRFISDGATWLNARAKEAYGKAYYLLEAPQRERLLEEVTGETWGENWIWTLFSYLFEALLGDPVYGANTEEAGWHWLGHVPGYPRPKAPFI